ncbi:hypothetical protein Leryth_023847 [Lithospermum erythrorhizon]|nr:hypothetical protein Leryth_023847 [Lithospermum erythrorhizon]
MAIQASTPMKKFLLFLSCILLLVGSCAGPLITRLYFLHGGKRIWLSSSSQTIAFPIILVPLSITYFTGRKTEGSDAKILLMKPFLIMFSLLIGQIMGILNFLYSSGSAKLPVSTSSLIGSSQLAFTASFAFFLVKQKFTPYSVNTVFLLTLGAALLGLRSNGDRPEGEGKKEYVVGFVMMILGACIYGFLTPLIERCFRKAKQEVCYSLAMEFNMVMCFSATVFCSVGMIINKDFQAIAREAREFDLGEVQYYIVLALNAIMWQMQLVGVNGVIFCSSALLSGILVSVALPITEVLAVIFYKEKFEVEKCVSLVLSLWGFASYFYGEIKLNRKLKNQSLEQEDASEKSEALELQQKSPKTSPDSHQIIFANLE